MSVNVRDLYSYSYPLGPIVTDSGLTSHGFRLLFDESNKLVSQLNREPSLVIGRKGSGKTTLLMSVVLTDEKAKVFFLPHQDVFAQIVREINLLADGVHFVEQVSRLWDFVLWGVIFNHLAREYKEKELLHFCQALGIHGDSEPYELIGAILLEIRSFPPSDWPVPEKIAYKKIANLTFLQAKKIAIDRLRSEDSRIYLLMDSLENFMLHIPAFSAAIAGLLRCLGEFNGTGGGRVILRCCLPAERYFDYIELSSNPLKDFRNSLLLGWSAGELIQLSAVRYSRFLREYFEEFYRDNIALLDFKKRSHLLRFWALVFPNFVATRLGCREQPMAYILRHTQLLPRHFIAYLNEIISCSLKQTGLAFGISSEYIRIGISQAEQLVRDQILEAYTTPTAHPGLACLETLKHLNTVFTWSEFDSIAPRLVRMGIPGASNRMELLSLLTQIGAVGRVVGESGNYVEGVFEYMVPHKLIVSDRDRFCIHPLFAEAYSANIAYPGVKPVYSYWEGVTDQTLKDWEGDEWRLGQDVCAEDAGSQQERDKELKRFREISKALESAPRKRCAFLSIDVVGSTEMKKDESKATIDATFQAYREMLEEIFKEYGAWKDSRTPDGVMSCFLEVKSAIGAAQSMLRNLERFNKQESLLRSPFRVRCGISEGEVAIFDDSNLEDIADRIIDVAGHLQKYASENTVWISEELYNSLDNKDGFRATEKHVDGLNVYEWAAEPFPRTT